MVPPLQFGSAPQVANDLKPTPRVVPAPALVAAGLPLRELVQLLDQSLWFDRSAVGMPVVKLAGDVVELVGSVVVGELGIGQSARRVAAALTAPVPVVAGEELGDAQEVVVMRQTSVPCVPAEG